MKLRNPHIDRKRVLMYVAIVLFAAFALFYHLDDRLLWGDEAETALLAVNITKVGVPTVTDGKNIVTLFGLGRDSNQDHIWIWSPWLDEYVAAASFALFGTTTFAARLPFVLIALVSILFLAWVSYKMYADHELTAFVMLLCATSVPFLLHARQCRYYALVIFAQMWMIWGYHQLIKGKSRGGILHLAGALTVQFYCNYIVVPATILSLLGAVLLHVRRNRNLLWGLSASLGIFALLVTPWLLYARPWHQASGIGLHPFGANLLYYLSSIHFCLVPLVLFIIPPVRYCLNRVGLPVSRVQPSPARDIETLLWILIPMHLLLLCITPGRYFRYLTPLIPVLILLAAIVLVRHTGPRIVRAVLIGILCLSNIVAVLSVYPVRGPHRIDVPFVNYAREITSDYEDRLEDVVSFFKKNAGPDESVFIFDPGFPLIFYTGMRIIDGRFNRKFSMDDLPDWILTESASGVLSYPPIKLPKSLEPYYRAVTITVHDTPRGGSRPDPHVHASFTAPRMKKMVIYRKIEHG